MKRLCLLEDKGYTDFIPDDAGHEVCESGHSFGPHIRKYYLIHFVVSGEGSFTNERGTHRLSSGKAFLIRPGELTTYAADKVRPWEYVWVGFRGRLAAEFDALPDVFDYDGGILSEITDAIEQGEGKEALLTSVIFKLFASKISEGHTSDYPSRVISYINLHYMENVSISAIADSLGLNRKYLARIFKEKRGISMQQFLIDKRLREAAKLLKQGYNVEQTSYMVGYSDPFGFSKAFKQKYGIPPREYSSKE